MKTLPYFLIALFFIQCDIRSDRMTAFLPGELWPDNNGVHINAHGGGILFHDGLYYWYGEHKIEGEAGNKAHVGVHVYSSKDLYNWKDEGVALKVVEDDPVHDITKECVLERPKVIFNELTGKFVMWFHLELKGQGYDAARSGVAVSDSPTGPFTYLGSFRPNAGYWPENVQGYHKNPVADTIKDKYCGGIGCLPVHVDSMNILGRDFEGGQMARDMNLFVDDDGKAYHIYSSEENSTTHISQLTEEYTGYSGKYARFFPNRYMEAPAIFKTSGGKYYFIGSDCTGWAPNAARSAVADDIFGPWTELGNPCVGEGAELTFESQSTFVLPVHGKKDAFIFMGDRWRPENAIDGRYVWLPIKIEDGKPVIRWYDAWDLSVFK
jgi:beta-xylosidase